MENAESFREVFLSSDSSYRVKVRVSQSVSQSQSQIQSHMSREINEVSASWFRRPDTVMETGHTYVPSNLNAELRKTPAYY